MELPKHYKLLKEHDKHFEIHDERDGKSFNIAKKDIHPAHQLRILKMEKKAFGGVSGDDGEDGPEEGVGVPAQGAQDAPPHQPIDQLMSGNVQNPQGGATGSWDAPPALSAPAAAPASGGDAGPAAGPAAQKMPENYPNSAELKTAIDSGIAGVKEESSAQQEQNKQLAVQYKKNVDMEQRMMAARESKMAQYQNQYDDIAKAVSAAKIDPNNYWHSKSTGNKIAAVIGLMLGGVGAGLTRGPNMAMETLNKHIENDIEAQRQNLGNKRSLLAMNLQAQGNMRAAMDATRLQMAAIAQGRLQQIAAETGNPIIAARAQQHMSAIQQNTMPSRISLANNEIQMSIRKDVMNRLQSQGQPGAQPVDMKDMERAGLVDKGVAEKEGAAISNRQNAEAYGIDQMRKLQKEQDLFGDYGIPNAINPNALARRKLYTQGVMQAVQMASPSKRLNPEFIENEVNPFVDKALFETGTTAEERMRGLVSLIRKHSDPTPNATHYRVPGALRPDQINMKTYDMGPVK